MSISRGSSKLSVGNREETTVLDQRPVSQRVTIMGDPYIDGTADGQQQQQHSSLKKRTGKKKTEDSVSASSMRYHQRCCCRHCSKGRAHDMLQSVNVHGFRRMDRSKRCGCRRTIWIIILLTSLSLCCFHIGTCITTYLAYPATIHYRLAHGDFDRNPSVTLCNQNRFRLSQLAKQGWLEPFRRQHWKGQGERKSPGNFTTSSRELMTMAAHQIDDMLLSCQFGGTACGQNNFSTTLTPDGVCFTLALPSGSSMDSEQGGNSRTLKLLLNVESYDHTPEGSQGSGISVRLNKHGDFPADEAAIIPTGSHSTVGAAVTMMTLVPPPFGPCDPHVTSHSQCLLQCRADLIMDRCGCKAFWMPQDYYAELKTFCSASVHFECVSSIVDHSRLGSFCNCPAPCEYTVYKPVSKATLLPSINMKSLLPKEVYTQVVAKFTDGMNTRQRLVPALRTFTSALVLNFTHALESVEISFEKLREKVANAVIETQSLDRKMGMRTNAHNLLGFMGMKKIVENGFIRGWDVVEHKTLRRVTGELAQTMKHMERTVTQLKETPTRDQTLRKMLNFIIESNLASTMDLAIRALDNFTEVNTAFLHAEPMSSHIITPGRRYDAALVPYDVLTHSSERQTEFYDAISSTLAGYAESIFTIQLVVKDLYTKNKLNESAYMSALEFFAEHSEDLEANLILFRDKIVYRSREILEHKVLQFKKLNHSMNLANREADSKLLSLRELIDNNYMRAQEQFVSFAQTAREYRDEPEFHTTSELAQAGLSKGLSIAFIHLQEIMWELASRSRELDEIWTRVQGTTKRVWEAMREDDSLRNFYVKINADVTDMVDNPMKSKFYKDIFLHAKMLDMHDEEVKGMRLEDFYTLLNADIQASTLEEQLGSLDEIFTGLKGTTSMTTEIQDSVRDLYGAYLDLRDSLHDFQRSVDFDEAFARQNLISLELTMDKLEAEWFVQEPSYTIAALIRDIAIALLVYLGASFITTFEFLDVLISALCLSGSSRKRKRRDSHGDYDDVKRRQRALDMDRSPVRTSDSCDPPYKYHNHMSRSVEV